MTIQQIYNLAIEMGINADPRGKTKIKSSLLAKRNKFLKLNKNDKKAFDREKLNNPYSDTRILNIADNQNIKTVLIGVDISVSELVLVEQLKRKGQKIDLVISHHPSGIALACLHDVVEQQAEMLSDLGVPINIAENIIFERVEELGRQLSPGNHNRTVDNAKMLAINFVCIHTPCDNLVYQFLAKEIEKNHPETLEDLFEQLKQIPEYHEACKLGIGPKIFAGRPEAKCGKIALTEITGGTSGSKKIYEKLSAVGVGTIVGMHMKEEHREEAEKNYINVVIAGHMPSDSLGMNLLCDKLEEKGIKIIPTSGFIRIKRK